MRYAVQAIVFLLCLSGTLTASCNCSESEGKMAALGLNGTAMKLEENMSGRVEVCWDGEWRGVLAEAVRTTQQANKICRYLGFKPGEILESSNASDNCTGYCWLNFESEDQITANCSHDLTDIVPTHSTCSNDPTEREIAVIKCEQGMLSIELIALMVVTPVLLSVILVGSIVLFLSFRRVRRLNVIIHRLIYKQQRLKAGLSQAALPDGSVRASMYAKPVGTNGGISELEKTATASTLASNTFPGPSQYSLLGNDKYENVDLNEIKQAY